MGEINNPTALLDLLDKHDLLIPPMDKDLRADVFAKYKRFDDGRATHFIMQGSNVLWAGTLDTVEIWVNSRFGSQ